MVTDRRTGEPAAPTGAPIERSRWNTDANYPELSNNDYGLAMSALNWIVRRWRRIRGVAERNGLPVATPRERHDDLSE